MAGGQAGNDIYKHQKKIIHTFNAAEVRPSSGMRFDAERTLGNLTASKFDIHVVRTGFFWLVLAGVDTVSMISNFKLKGSLGGVLH